MRKVGQLAAAGSTGNNTHASVGVDEREGTAVLEMEITAVGATPTISYKFQGSEDPTTVSDALSDWFDLGVLPHDNISEDFAFTRVAVGVYANNLDLTKRPVRKVRLVTSANTNVTYEAEAYQ